MPKMMNRCFITGQSCTHKRQIALRRKENHEKGIVSVFVVMSFTDLSFSMFDIIKEGVEQAIKEQARFNEQDELVFKESKEHPLKERERSVGQVYFERADFSVSTGHVICNRVCDLIQVADIVLIDVSHPNPNVFYELGMAMSMGKDVLPICFLKKYYYKPKNDSDNEIESFPWIKKLYEFFSLYCHATATGKSYKGYDRSNEKKTNESYSFDDESKKLYVGKFMYRLLADGITRKESTESKNDTLMVYSEKGLDTPEKFKIVMNNIRKITEAVANPELFHGDQALILAQDNKLYEKDKDDENARLIGYNVADITRYGVQKAIEKAQKNSVFYPSCFSSKQEEDGIREPQHSRAFIAYGRSPIFMERIKNASHREFRPFMDADLQNYTESPDTKVPGKFTKDKGQGGVYDCINEKDREYLEWKTPFYTYLNVMVTYMRYVNQVLIDTYDNDIVAYFWLGVCHAAGVDTVRIERTFTEDDRQYEEDRKRRMNEKNGDKPFADEEEAYYKNIRSVFDVAGLWCAYINARNIQEYLQQLYKVEVSILEHHHAYVEGRVGDKEIEEYLARRSKEGSKKELQERYYRHAFWTAICRNDLKLYQGIGKLPINREGQTGLANAKWCSGMWDNKTSGLLTQQMLIYQKAVLASIEAVEEQGEKTPKEQEDAAFSAIYIGDNRVNNGCREFLSKFPEPEYIYSVKTGTPENCEETGTPENCEETDTPKKCRKASQREIRSPLMLKSWTQPVEECFGCKEKVCQLRLKESYESYGGLFLQHKGSKKDNQGENGDSSKQNSAENEQLKGRQDSIYIMGGGGVTTYAMASIFVDADLRYSGLSSDIRSVENKDLVLSSLQSGIRRTYIDKCIEKIRKKLGEEECDVKIKKRLESKSKLKLNTDRIDLEKWEDVENYVDQLFSRYFIPFVTKNEVHGMRKSLEFYLQAYFERNVREKDEMDETKLWNEYDTFNKAMDEIVDCIVDGFMDELECDITFEAVLRVNVNQKLDEKRDNYIKSIKGFSVTLEKVGVCEYTQKQ